MAPDWRTAVRGVTSPRCTHRNMMFSLFLSVIFTSSQYSENAVLTLSLAAARSTAVRPRRPRSMGRRRDPAASLPRPPAFWRRPHATANALYEGVAGSGLTRPQTGRAARRRGRERQHDALAMSNTRSLSFQTLRRGKPPSRRHLAPSAHLPRPRPPRPPRAPRAPRAHRPPRRRPPRRRPPPSAPPPDREH